MAIAPRPNGKAKKIAYKILGVPANIAYKPGKLERYVNKRLQYEDTMRSR